MFVCMSLRQVFSISRMTSFRSCLSALSLHFPRRILCQYSQINCCTTSTKTTFVLCCKSQSLPAVFNSKASWEKATWHCGFHTSPQRNLHPLLWMVIRPLARVATALTGRKLRMWWKALPEERRAYWRRRMLERRHLFYVVGCGVLTFGIVHYITHVSETPVTHRRRYLAFTKEQFMKLSEFMYTVEFEGYKDHIVPPTHPVYQRVVNVVRKLVDSNQDLEFMRQQTWTILVVDSEDVNAFVLPMGQIFVSTELLRLTETDGQLAVVLAHEISHALLSHGAEQVSFAAVLDVFIIIIMAAIWAFMPTDGIAIVTHWFYNKVIEILLRLPYSRRLEEEADEVGLQLMAKACYDVRESSTFWQKMALNTQLATANDDTPQWLSSHPNHESRAKKLDSMIPAAEALRLDCNCPPLKTRDPRTALANLRQLVEEEKKKDAASSSNVD